jgi:outer membrane protein, heavy metal efflux system
MRKEMTRSKSLLVGAVSVVTLLIIAMHAVTSFAVETEEEVTLGQALDYFYKHNYDLLINKYEIDKASSDLRGAKLLPNPNVSFDYTGVETNRSLSTGNNTQSTFRIDQLIELAGKRALRTSVAQENLEAVRLSHQDFARGILVGFYSLYFGLSFDILNVTLNRFGLEQFDRSLDVAEKRFTAGFLSLADYTKLKVTRVDVENNLLNAEHQLKIDTEQLRLLIGIDKHVRPASGQIQGTFQEYREEELLPRAYENRKDLLALQRQLKSAEYNVSLAKARRIPDVTIGAEYERYGVDRDPGMGIGISLPIPLFNRNQAEIDKRLVEYRQIELQIIKTKRQIETDIRQALQNFTTSRKTYETYMSRKKDIEDLRERSVKAFSLGGITVLDFLDTQRIYREFINKYNLSLIQVALNQELVKLHTGEAK